MCKVTDNGQVDGRIIERCVARTCFTSRRTLEQLVAIIFPIRVQRNPMQIRQHCADKNHSLFDSIQFVYNFVATAAAAARIACTPSAAKI
jgi:hypothetical protein